MASERRSKNRLRFDTASHYKGMTTAELDTAIRELKKTVSRLIAERKARNDAGNMQSDVTENPEKTD